MQNCSAKGITDMQLPLETILNSLEDAVVCLDETRQVAFLNAAAARLFDCDPQRAIGQPMTLGMLAVLGQLDFSQMQLSTASPRGARRLHGKQADGNPFALEALVTRVTAGGKDFYIIDMRDITHQQQMEKAL